MESNEKYCPDCREIMVEGFILDLTYGGQLVPRWVRGKPESSMWSGVKARGKECYSVATFRCVQCGYLRSYATDEAAPPSMWGT